MLCCNESDRFWPVDLILSISAKFIINGHKIRTLAFFIVLILGNFFPHKKLVNCKIPYYLQLMSFKQVSISFWVNSLFPIFQLTPCGIISFVPSDYQCDKPYSNFCCILMQFYISWSIMPQNCYQAEPSLIAWPLYWNVGYILQRKLYEVALY